MVVFLSLGPGLKQEILMNIVATATSISSLAGIDSLKSTKSIFPFIIAFVLVRLNPSEIHILVTRKFLCKKRHKVKKERSPALLSAEKPTSGDLFFFFAVNPKSTPPPS